MEIEKKTSDNTTHKKLFEDILHNSWDKDTKRISKGITKKMALEIKNNRVGDEAYSWRSIATWFVAKYPEVSTSLNIVDGNQISGMQLCDAAMNKLKETTDQGWN